MRSTIHDNTLLRYRFNPEHKAERGRHGEGSDCHGKNGNSIELTVPVGTVVYDQDSGQMLFDFSAPEQIFRVARGGRGGRGNGRFATPTHQAPRNMKTAAPAKRSISASN